MYIRTQRALAVGVSANESESKTDMYLHHGRFMTWNSNLSVQQKRSLVIKVDPRYTSQCWPAYVHMERSIVTGIYIYLFARITDISQMLAAL